MWGKRPLLPALPNPFSCMPCVPPLNCFALVFFFRIMAVFTINGAKKLLVYKFGYYGLGGRFFIAGNIRVILNHQVYAHRDWVLGFPSLNSQKHFLKSYKTQNQNQAVGESRLKAPHNEMARILSLTAPFERIVLSCFPYANSL